MLWVADILMVRFGRSVDVQKDIEGSRKSHMNALFFVYLHNYCCALCLKHSLILLLLGLNEKSSMHVVLVLQRDRATLSCSWHFGLGLETKYQRHLSPERD